MQFTLEQLGVKRLYPTVKRAMQKVNLLRNTTTMLTQRAFFETSISMSCSVIHCIMEKSGSGSAMKSNSLFSKNVLSLVLVIGCPPYVCFSNNILELPMTFFNYQIANFILHYPILMNVNTFNFFSVNISTNMISLINNETFLSRL